MLTRIGVSYWVAACLLLGWFVPALRAADPSRDQRPAAGPQAVEAGPEVALVRQALKAEVDGDNGRRTALLDQARQTAPNDERANWHSGRILAGQRWLALDEAQRLAKADRQLARYATLRDSASNTPRTHRELARWCRRSGLDDQARLHWILLLDRQSGDKEAMRALDLRNYRGRLLTRQQIDQWKRDVAAREEFMESWEPKLKAWKDAAQSDDSRQRQAALAEVSQVDDPRTISALERMLSPCSEQLGLAVVTALRGMSDPAATNSLIRHALASRYEVVRKEAAAQLGARPLHDFAPRLLNRLSAPVEFSYFADAVRNDGLYRVELFRKGPQADHLHSEVIRWHTRLEIYFPRRGYTLDPGRAKSDRLARTSRNRIVSLRKRVDAGNRRISAENERVFTVLKIATGKNLPDEATVWWKWWYDFNEIHGYDDKPTYETSDIRSIYVDRHVVNMSCFVRGTMVATEVGPRPIESIRIGDRVLSQDANSGELAYKIVLNTTVRPPSETLRLAVGKEEIWTTLGHPFWVAGEGWRMAKQLSCNSKLHGVRGAVSIDAIEQGPKIEAYNLVVADFNSYFVGGEQVLVHDNTARRPTGSLVPGLPADK